MLYMVELGPIEQSIARQAMQAGRALDKRIQNAPELTQGLQFYLQAFFDLDSERSHGMAVTRIPRSKVREYAREFELTEDEAGTLEYFVTELDTAQCDRIVKARENANK